MCGDLFACCMRECDELHFMSLTILLKMNQPTQELFQPAIQVEPPNKNVLASDFVKKPPSR